MRFAHLKIAHKGLILVVLPAMFFLAFETTLSFLLQQAERDLARANHSELVIVKADSLLKSFFDAGSSVFAYGTLHDLIFARRFEAINSKIAAEFEALEQMGPYNDSQTASLRRIKILTNRCMELLGQAKDNVDQGNFSIPFLTETEARREVERLLASLMTEIHSFVEQERQSERMAPEDARRSRELVHNMMFFAAAATVVMAFMLARYFGFDINARLKVLTDNSNLLEKGQPLLAPLKGEDEIAVVDKGFHRMAEALADASRKERAMVDNALDVICSLDASGKFTRINHAAEKLWGYASETIVGTHYETIVRGNDLQKARMSFEQLQQGHPVAPFELATLRASENLAHTVWSVHWSETDQSYFCVIHDISDRKAVEKLKQEFVAMVSHDLRAPISAVGFTLNLLEEGALGALSDVAKDRVITAERSLSRLLHMINDLLDLERLEAGRLELDCEEEQLAFVIDDAVQTVEPLASGKNISISVDPIKEKVFIDKARIIQVLVNILSNAIKFSEEHSAIDVNVVEHPTDADLVEVRVVDRGRGIPEDRLGSIFNRFEQVERSDATKRGGTGLGLAICKELIKHHGGDIGAANNPVKGSTFWFTLPRVGSRSSVQSAKNSAC
jgi:PAS domain S-box-containing protein